jgi:capsular polysaccharide biosynthesis protein/Mrp family chromosome partitioning ATPase
MVILRGKWIIAVSIVVGLALAALATSLSAKVYESTALLETGVGGQVPARRTFDQQQAGEALARSYATTLDSQGFLARIAPDVAGGSLSAGELASRVDASLVADTSLVSLTATGHSPTAAHDLAAEVAAAFTAALRTDARASVEAQSTDLRRRIAAVDAEIARTASSDALAPLTEARTGLTRQLADVIVSGGTVGIALTSPPDTPTSPIKPRPVLNAVAGVLLGALVGIALSWLWLVAAGGAPLRTLPSAGLRSGGHGGFGPRRRRRPARSPDNPSASGPDEGPGAQTDVNPADGPDHTDPGKEDQVGRADKAGSASAGDDEAEEARHQQAERRTVDEGTARPSPHLGMALVGAKVDDEEAEAAYDTIFAGIQDRAPEGAPLVLALLAEREFDGRQDVSQGIARAAARAGRNALLADGDGRGRRLSAALNYSDARGLGDLITGVSQTRPCEVRLSRGSSFAFMPAGKQPPDARPFWDDEEVRTAVGRLADTRGMILIESPAAATSEPGARAVAAASLGIVLVAWSPDAGATELLGRVLGERGRSQVLGAVTTTPVADSTGPGGRNGSVPAPHEERASPAARF